ncbi:MAG: anti-sigma factor [Rhizobacter sp.]|nr:anti-sigma factor [Burkholderiales bacterium]
MNTPVSRGDDIQCLAGEYVLGTLSASSRAGVEARMANDAALRTAVEQWQETLAPLHELVEPVEPSAQLWTRIESSVAVQIDAAKASESFRRAVPPDVTPITTWWDSLRLWRGLAASGLAATALMGVVVFTQQALSPTPGYMVVLVGPQDKSPGWVVQAGTNSQQARLIPLGKMEVPGDKSLQFWTKGDDWKGPVSLGLVKPGQSLEIPLDKLPPLQPNQLFEITLEPYNGSPLDRPTGPILFIGRAVKII